MSHKHALAWILLIWTLSALLASPQINSKIEQIEGTADSKSQCKVFWPDGSYPSSSYDNIYNILVLVLTYFVPILTMAILYYKVGKELWGYEAIGENVDKQQRAIMAKKKIVKMMIVVVIIFALCWLPYHAFFVVNYYMPMPFHENTLKRCYLFLYWLAMSNTMYNPIIIYFMNSKVYKPPPSTLTSMTTASGAVAQHQQTNNNANNGNSTQQTSASRSANSSAQSNRPRHHYNSGNNLDQARPNSRSSASGLQANQNDDRTGRDFEDGHLANGREENDERSDDSISSRHSGDGGAKLSSQIVHQQRRFGQTKPTNHDLEQLSGEREPFIKIVTSGMENGATTTTTTATQTAMATTNCNNNLNLSAHCDLKEAQSPAGNNSNQHLARKSNNCNNNNNNNNNRINSDLDDKLIEFSNSSSTTKTTANKNNCIQSKTNKMISKRQSLANEDDEDLDKVWI